MTTRALVAAIAAGVLGPLTVAAVVAGFYFPRQHLPTEVSPGAVAQQWMSETVSQQGGHVDRQQVNAITDDGHGHLVVNLTVHIQGERSAQQIKVTLERAPYRVTAYTTYNLVG